MHATIKDFGPIGIPYNSTTSFIKYMKPLEPKFYKLHDLNLP